MVNPKDEKIGPESFELLKVLGKGGYGKVCYHNNFVDFIYTCNHGANFIKCGLIALRCVSRRNS